LPACNKLEIREISFEVNHGCVKLFVGYHSN